LAENRAYPENWKATIPLVAPEAAGESFVADWSFSLPPGLDYSGLHYSLKGPLLVHALEITGSFRYFYTPSVAEEGQNVDEMTVTYPQDAVEIDLSEQIWESLVLSLPDQVLCRDDCAGLCPRCGADLNLGDCGCPPQGRDPRLQVLKDILPDVSEEE
jgi:hypothetical protein